MTKETTKSLVRAEAVAEDPNWFLPLLGVTGSTTTEQQSRINSPSEDTRVTSPWASTRMVKPGEIFIRMSKQGSTINGLMETFATQFSVSLQHGVPTGSAVRQNGPHPL